MNSINSNTVANSSYNNQAQLIAVAVEESTITMTMSNIISNNPSSQSAFNNNNNKKRKMTHHHYHQEEEEEEEEDSDTTTTRTLQSRNRQPLLPPPIPPALLPLPPKQEEDDEEEGSGGSGNVRDYLRGQLVTSFPSTLHLILRFESLSTDDDDIDDEDYEDYDEFDGDDDDDIIHLIEEDDEDDDIEIEIDNTTSSEIEHETSPLLLPVIGWSKDGKSFIIYDEERFVNEIMSQYFLCGYNSSDQDFNAFEEILNIWGFTITTTHHHSSSVQSCDAVDDYDHVKEEEEEEVAVQHICSHPLFIRDYPDAIQQMKCSM